MQGHWAAAANMNKTVMGAINVLEAERGCAVGPLLERLLAVPLDRRGRRCYGALGRPCISDLRTRHPA
eukprot:492135-Alexandrium_andersonii.AAC.1